MARSSHPDPWVKKAQWLVQALIISGTLNVGLICTFIYLAVKDSKRPLSGRCYSTSEVSLCDQKSLQELLFVYSSFSFQELLSELRNHEHVEAGYKRRDLALACLIRFHHFNLEKALGGDAFERREIDFTKGGKPLKLEVFPGLADSQYRAINQYSKTEKWPLTAEGLFLKIQSSHPPYDVSLLEAFYLTDEFHFLNLLFSKTDIGLKKEHLVALLSEGSWLTLSEMAKRLRSHIGFTVSNRRQFLTILLAEGSKLAAKILLETDQDYCLKCLDNETVLSLCTVLGDRVNTPFLKGLLKSPRPNVVWEKAAALLYEQVAEEIPENFDLGMCRRRFIEHKSERSSTTRRTCASYTVVSGDSLWKIARKHNTTVVRLREANQLRSDKLKVGQKLKIPSK